MNQSGYSAKPLVQKLGYLPGDLVLLFDAPDDIATYLNTENITCTGTTPATWLHAFFTTKSDAERFIEQTALGTIEKGLWFSWPKRASHVPTDLTEQTFRDLLLPMGWVDTKVAAIDQTWSGLKFLRRRI